MPKISSSRNPHLWPRAARQIAFLEPLSLLVALPFLAASPAAEAREYFVGGPVHEHDMEIVANYLVGIEMAPMPPDMPTGQDVIHLEADVHATADNVYGYPDGSWVPYLAIEYSLERQDSTWKTNGKLRTMTAKDGPHYADNVKMSGPGTYRVTYRFRPPETNGSCDTLTKRQACLHGGRRSVKPLHSPTRRNESSAASRGS